MTVDILSIDATNDDVNEQDAPGGIMSALNATRVNIGDRGADINWGGRWKTNLSDISGATINTVTMKHLSRETLNNTFTGDWFSEDAAAPPEFAATANNLTNRTKSPVSCEGDGTDYGPWTDDVLESYTGPTDGNNFSDVIQYLADTYTPTAIVLMHFTVSGSGERKGRSFDHGSTAPQLHIDFTAGGGAAVTGKGAISVAVTVVGAGAMDLIGAGGIDATAEVLGAGTTGALLEGQGAISAAATVVGAGVRERNGEGDILTSVEVVGAGERQPGGAGAISASVEVVGVGELSGTLQGRGDILAAVTVVGVGTHFVSAPPGSNFGAAISVVGSAVLDKVVGAGAIDVSVEVVGQGDSGDIVFTVFGHEVELDPDTMPEDHIKFWIGVLSAPAGGTAHVRMWNITLGAEVAGTDLTTGNVTPTRLVSAATITLPKGVHLYRAEYGGLAGFTYKTNSAKLRVFGLEPV